MVEQALHLTAAVLSSSADRVSSTSVAAVMGVVTSVVNSGGDTGPLFAAGSTVPSSLLAIVNRVSTAAVESSAVAASVGFGVSSGGGRRLTASDGATLEWVHGTVGSIARGVAAAMIPGSPVTTLTAGSTSDGSTLQVLYQMPCHCRRNIPKLIYCVCCEAIPYSNMYFQIFPPLTVQRHAVPCFYRTVPPPTHKSASCALDGKFRAMLRRVIVV